MHHKHQSSPLKGALWEKVAPGMLCQSSTRFRDASNQIECQTKCAAISSCPGISYTPGLSWHTHRFDFNKYAYRCLVCTNDVLRPAPFKNTGFYRKQGKYKL